MTRLDDVAEAVCERYGADAVVDLRAKLSGGYLLSVLVGGARVAEAWGVTVSAACARLVEVLAEGEALHRLKGFRC